MKAHWSRADQTWMSYSPLPFLPDDVVMIRSGLALGTTIHVPKPPTVPPGSPADEKL